MLNFYDGQARYYFFIMMHNNNGVLHRLTAMEGSFMNVREGLIPTILGSAVTATGYALKQKNGSNQMIANTIFGIGLARILLGAIDLVEHRR